MGVCVYAVVPAATRPNKVWRGVEGEPLRLVRCGSVALLVGETEATPQPHRLNLERHDALIRCVAAGVPAILPARFALIVDDDHRLRALVNTRSAELRRGLRYVTGREQMTLRVRASATSRSARGRARPPARAGGPGQAYLIARAGALHSPPEADVTDLLQRLSTVVHGERSTRAQARTMLTLYHLIDRGRAADYLAIIREYTSGRERVTVRVSGPFPPYAFASGLA